MKTRLMILSTALMLMACSVAAMAQPHAGQGQRIQKEVELRIEQPMPGIPNLTDDQKTKLDALKVPFQKQMQAFKNKMAELKAHQRTLETLDKPDMKAINANIDEITKVQNQMMKAEAEQRQQIRVLLTDEQKLWFDQHHKQMRGKAGKGDGKREHMRLQMRDANCPNQ